MERLKTENEALSRKCNELQSELATVKTERDNYAAKVDELIIDHDRSSQKVLTPEKRDRILAALQSGHQSAVYKRVKAVLDRFINEVKGDG